MSLNIPLLDIPVDVIAGDDVTGQLLNEYGLFPCRIKACVFALCVRGVGKCIQNIIWGLCTLRREI